MWLCDMGKADHCIVLDGMKGVILDSEEELKIRLSEQTLRMCGGKDVTKLHVAELFELVGCKKK